MEEDEVKSAFEIAMERISGLPQLTPQEIAAQKEKEYGPIGEALAGRYLSGLTAGDTLPDEVDRYKGEPGHIVRRALIRSLCGSISLEDPRTASVAIAGLLALNTKREGFFEQAGRDLRQMISQFEGETQAKSSEFTILATQQLKSLGISGSALKLNLEENENWQRELARIRQTYQSRLSELREKLLREAG